MPAGITWWSDKWLDLMYGNEIKARLWCRSVKGKSYLAYCTLCFKEFSISNSGFNQIKQHCQLAKHKKISDVWFGAENQKQTLITGQKHQEASASASAETTLDLKSERLDKARKKIWILIFWSGDRMWTVMML